MTQDGKLAQDGKLKQDDRLKQDDKLKQDGSLSDLEAQQRLVQDGPNELPVSQPRSLLRLLREVVLEPMFLSLVACGIIYMLLGDHSEALMLLGFVFVVMAMTFFQQRRTERSFDALRDLSSPHAIVVRGGQARKILARELVLGDVVLVAEGERIPADMQLLESSCLTVDESMLTGESVPVAKFAAGAGAAVDADVATNAPAHVFSGTLVTQGTARQGQCHW